MRLVVEKKDIPASIQASVIVVLDTSGVVRRRNTVDGDVATSMEDVVNSCYAHRIIVIK